MEMKFMSGISLGTAIVFLFLKLKMFFIPKTRDFFGGFLAEIYFGISTLEDLILAEE